MAVLLKIVQRIINNPKDVNFNDVKRLLEFFGYESFQSKRGSSHYVFRKKGVPHICVPKKKPVNVHYVKEIISILDLRSWYEEKKH